MNRSLSVILPVHNAQSWLAESVNEILDVVAELTDRFELIIMDDGSTDGTWDVGRELARRYPQVRPLREPNRCGGSLAIQPGLREAQGDVVMAHCGEAAIDSGEIVRLWRSLEPIAPVPPAPKLIRTAATRAAFNPTASRRKIGSPGLRTRHPSGGFRLLRTGSVGDVRRTIAASQEAAGRRRHELRPTADATGSAGDAQSQARRPNFLSHSASRVSTYRPGSD